MTFRAGSTSPRLPRFAMIPYHPPARVSPSCLIGDEQLMFELTLVLTAVYAV